MLTTKKYIETIYKSVVIEIVKNPMEIEKHSDFDILHIFNMQNYEFAKNA